MCYLAWFQMGWFSVCWEYLQVVQDAGARLLTK